MNESTKKQPLGQHLLDILEYDKGEDNKIHESERLIVNANQETFISRRNCRDGVSPYTIGVDWLNSVFALINKIMFLKEISYVSRR